MFDGPDEERLQALLAGARALPPDSRPVWLEEACAGDAGLKERIEAQLAMPADEASSPSPAGVPQTGPIDGVPHDEREAPRAAVLKSGDRVGPYQVRGLLGAGGMGRVYRAYDSVLGREVALKALGEAFSADSERMRRFEREARLLAALNHPNIAAIYGFERHGERPCLVMELVEGWTLEERLARAALPLAEAVEVALQIADALEEAHRKGVVHRDLKPSNVKLAAGGRVKLLDFGLAREVAPNTEETLSAAGLTATGTILGTAPYMSPEQARGEDVDERTDVWAFGCLLFEMLAGRRAFDGPSLPDMLAAILRDEADWSALPPLPSGLLRLLRRCLRKDMRDRLRHIGDARLELLELEAEDDALQRPRRRAGRAARALPWALAAASLAGLAVVALVRRPAASLPQGAHLAIDLPAGVSLAHDFAPPFALSPDGRSLVLVGLGDDGRRALYLRPLARDGLERLAGTDDGWQPFFSPDGRWIGFFADRKLKKVPVEGGTPVVLAEVGNNPRGASWTLDGRIVLTESQTSGLARLSEAGGALEELTRLDADAGERSHRWPQALPDGSVIFTVLLEGGTFDDARIDRLDAAGRRSSVLTGGSSGRILPDSRLLYARAGRLFAAALDARTGGVRGTPEAVVEGVRYDARNGGTQAVVGGDGTLVYVPAPPASLERRLVWVGPHGERTPLPGVPRRFYDPRLSSDGKRLAVRIGSLAESEIWTQDLASGTMSRVALGPGAFHPVWDAHGRDLIVGRPAGAGWQLVQVAADGSDRSTVLATAPRSLYACDQSHDGRSLIYQERRPSTGWDLLLLERDSAGQPAQPLAATQANETNARFSPDGRWVAYESDELDAVFSIYVRPVRGDGDKVRASSQGGRMPIWGRAGELFYWRTSTSNSDVRRVAWHADGERFVVDGERAGWEGADASGLLVSDNHSYDRDAASGRLLFLESLEPARGSEPPRISIVLGWLHALRAQAR